MDSEDDMFPYDSDDQTVEEGDFSSGEEDSEAETTAAGDDDSDYGNDSDNPEDILAKRFQSSFTILSESDIRDRQQDDIMEVTAVLSIPSVSASILLRHYNWDVSKVNDEWFADEQKVRKSVGLMERPVIQIPNASKLLTCGICFETYSRENFRSAACGHPYCSTCWTGYIRTAIHDGPGCLMLRCPEPTCVAAIDRDTVNSLVSEADKERYNHYLLRSYIIGSKKMKWCPAPSCVYAVDFVVGSENYDVSCRCSYGFCWNCMEEAHRPVDCATVAKWILKNSAESENMNWLLVNTKPCPKCKRPIEKNQGCMHITCTPPCKFEFCWLCLRPWLRHREGTSGFYACNVYESAKKKGLYDKEQQEREMAKNHLDRYTHYYERWASNQSSMKKALADLQMIQTKELEKLSVKQGLPESQLGFLTEAWEQVAECRRVLKWTYAYGYYLPESELAKKTFFEYLQGEAEFGLEKLHHCVEKDFQVVNNSKEQRSNEFLEYKTKLFDLTRVTRVYFQNLVRALENGLLDVDSQSTSNGEVNNSSKSRTSKTRCGRN